MEKVVLFVEHLVDIAVAKAKEAIAPELTALKTRLDALEAKEVLDLDTIADSLDKALSATPVVASDPAAPVAA